MIEIRELYYYVRATKKILSLNDRNAIALALSVFPNSGDVIPGTGGLRKLRHPLPGRGKSGGARIIYYFAVVDDVVYLMFAYTKAQQENLTPEQLKKLSQLLQKIKEKPDA